MDEIAVPQPSGELDAVGSEDANEEQRPPDAALTSSRVSDAVNNRLLPALIRHLENRNEAEDVLRIPVSIGIAKIALHLPGDLSERHKSLNSSQCSARCCVASHRRQETSPVTRCAKFAL
jgi:hypothetical protein